MRPLTQVQNPKQARWFPVNSTIRAVSTLATRSFRLPVYKRPSYQSGLQIARFANSARSRFGDDELARGWQSNRPQMGCVSWARLSGPVSSDEAAVGPPVFCGQKRLLSPLRTHFSSRAPGGPQRHRNELSQTTAAERGSGAGWSAK